MRAFIDEDTLEFGIVQVLLDLEGDDLPEDVELPDGSLVSWAKSEITDAAGNALYVMDGVKKPNKEGK